MTYYLQDNPNPNTGQFGWPRKRVSGVIGVHTAENNTDFDGADPGAEDVARFIGRRADYGSYHALADADSRIKLVHPSYAAWADTENNAHAMSVSGAMQAARWRELTPERAAAITRNMAYAAAELVQDAIAAGLLNSPTPARRITPAEAIAGSKAGFYGHGETNPGRRYDPGQNFDWNLFLSTYASAIGGLAAMGGTITPLSEEDDMAYSEADLKRIIAEAVQPAHDVTRQNVVDELTLRTEAQHVATRSTIVEGTQAQSDVTRGYLADRVKEASPADLAGQINAAGLAEQVRDELVKLLGGK